MDQLSISNLPNSDSKIIASSGVFQIELIKHTGKDDFPQLIEMMLLFTNILINPDLYPSLPDIEMKLLAT